MSTGFVPFDKIRLNAVIQRCENYCDGYITNDTPIDLPESSPKAPIQGVGLNKPGVS